MEKVTTPQPVSDAKCPKCGNVKCNNDGNWTCQQTQLSKQSAEIARLERELAEEHEAFGKEIDRCIAAETESARLRIKLTAADALAKAVEHRREMHQRICASNPSHPYDSILMKQAELATQQETTAIAAYHAARERLRINTTQGD